MKLAQTKALALALAMSVMAGGAGYAQSAGAPLPLSPEEIENLRREMSAQAAAQIQSPEEIEAARRRQLDQQRASSVAGYSNNTQRRTVTRSITVIGNGRSQPYDNQSLDLWDGVSTSVSFYDHRGEAWPVENVHFDRNAVSINNDGCGVQDRDQTSVTGMGNILTVRPCQFWTDSNMQVLLRGETRPLSFGLGSGSTLEDPLVDGAVTVAVQSDIRPDHGQTRIGTINNSWVLPNVRAMRIDPIDTRSDNRVNEIYVMNGVTTDISFMDGNKNPWPIEEIVYPPGIVAVNGPCVAQEAGLRAMNNNDSGTVYLTACMDARATVGIRLKGRAGAISLLTIPAREGVVQPDGTLTMTVTGVSPNAPAPTAVSATAPGRPSSASGYGIGFLHDRYLDDFLMATPPQGARRANIIGGDGTAEGWFFDGALYIRGGFTIVNPANDAQGSSGDGTVNVYKYGPPVSRILAQDLAGREFVMSID